MSQPTTTTRIELEEVHILSRLEATEFRCARPWGCISISTESDDFARISESNRVDLLQIAFADLEQEPSPLTLEIYPELQGALLPKLPPSESSIFLTRYLDGFPS